MRTPPNAVEVERALLGAVLIAPKLADEAAELEPEQFYDPRHAFVWRAVRELQGASQAINGATVADRLASMGHLEAVGGLSWVAELVGDNGGWSVARFAEIIAEKATARALLECLGELLDRGYTNPDTSGLLEEAQARVYALTAERRVAEVKTLKAIVKESFLALQARMDAGRAPGLRIGFTELDTMLCGWHPGDQVILGGRSSMGKTALAMGLALETARHGGPVLVFSVEMSALQLADRALCSEARADSQAFRHGVGMRAIQAQGITSAAGRLKDLPVHVDDSSTVTVPQIRARARHWSAEHKRHGLLVVDYLQLVATAKNRNGSREQEVAEVSRQLKAIARETNSTVLALAQVSRKCEERENKRPMLSDLRESGSLEQDADVVLFVFRDEYYDAASKDKGTAEVICAKQRNGPIGTARLAFDEASGRFADLAAPRKEF